MYLNLKEVPFSRYGSYFAFSHFINAGGISNDDLYLRTIHGGEHSLPLLKILMTQDGKIVDYKENASPHVLKLEAGECSAEICIPEPRVIRVRGSHCGLRLKVGTQNFKSAYRYKDTHYELNAYSHKLLLTPLKGTLKVDAPWESTSCQYVTADFLPDENGELEFALEEYLSSWIPREYTESFDNCVDAVKKDFDKWISETLPVPQKYQESRELAAYINWSSVVSPSGHIKRDTMFMSKNWMCNVWSWDYCFNSMALAKGNPEQCWNQFMYLVDYQDNIGSIPDCLNDMSQIWGFVKPPIQGWALNWMMERTGFIDDAKLRQIYGPLCMLTDWWMNFHDTDGDGLPEYYHGNDSGWDNSTVFKDGIPIASPDLAAFLVIQMEVLAKAARRLGFTADAAGWDSRAEALLQLCVGKLWTGDGFSARLAGSGELIKSDSLITYMPVLLGHRLPGDILAVLINKLKDKNLFLTDFGLATEIPSSEFYKADGYWRGPIWAPSTMLIVDGLISAGEKELAREISLKFCEMIKKSGMAENFDAQSGDGLRDRAYTWTSSVFLMLANELLPAGE